jgi:hypothetical protein
MGLLGVVHAVLLLGAYHDSDDSLCNSVPQASSLSLHAPLLRLANHFVIVREGGELAVDQKRILHVRHLICKLQ